MKNQQKEIQSKHALLCVAALLVSIPLTECKQHFVASDPISKDHPKVMANAPIGKQCLFEYENDDRLCQEYQTYMDIGFEWVQQNENYVPENKLGYHNLDLAYYLKFYLKNNFVLQIQRLLNTQLIITWPETYFKYVTGVHYNRYTNFLCFEMYTDITDFLMTVEHAFQFVQCQKTLVNCMSDFGQWWSDDSSTSEKPFSPYAKWFDYCDLSGQTTFMIQQYQPFNTASGYNPKFRFVGSGGFDSGCFPGQIDFWIYKLEKLWSPKITNTMAPNPFYQGGLEGKKHPEHENFEGTFLTNMLGPYIQKLLITMFDNMKGSSKQSHGTWTNMDNYPEQETQ